MSPPPKPSPKSWCASFESAERISIRGGNNRRVRSHRRTFRCPWSRRFGRASLIGQARCRVSQRCRSRTGQTSADAALEEEVEVGDDGRAECGGAVDREEVVFERDTIGVGAAVVANLNFLF